MKIRMMVIAATTTALLAAGLAAPAEAGTVQNLERERALVVQAILNPALSAAERQARVAEARSRLVDLERMVLRDDSLKGRNTRDVRRAFANYELTFLAHASAEKRQTIIDTWLSQVGVTTDALMAATTGRR
ncbi:MAG: hypothetical protein QF893_23020 [Alphaproteobacteria bacterium]|jgi:hypothetical protein|nr:hypothetical protein [Alphaproteobacteria bacterium]